LVIPWLQRAELVQEPEGSENKPRFRLTTVADSYRSVKLLHSWWPLNARAGACKLHLTVGVMTKRLILIALAVAALGACGAGKPASSSLPDGGAGGAPAGSDAAADAAASSDAASSDVASSAPSSDAMSRVDGEVKADGSSGGAGGGQVDGGSDVPRGASDGGASDGGASDGGSAGSWPTVLDYGARGPFPIARETNTGPGAAYDIFRPATLGAQMRRHPIVSWANGTLFGIADYQMLLEHWASHGFVVIAGHTNSTAGGGTHKAAIDWMIAEAARAGSAYFGVLDTANVGAAGHSQGGGATIAAGANKPGPTGIKTTLPLMPILSYESDKTILAKQTVPMLNINATMDTRDPTGAVADQIFAAATRELVQAAFIGIHEDAMTASMYAPTLAWFRLRLMGDEAARPMFYPAGTCGLCQDKAWKQVRYKNVP
jgi:hypothetical protein